MPDDATMADLGPDSLIIEARSAPLRQFLGAYGDTWFLLVRLDDPTGAVAGGLLAASATSLGTEAIQPNLNSMNFHTKITSPGSLFPSVRTELRPPGERALAQRVAATPHFALPLRKQKGADANYMERISVGRARNKDISLRHSSVSKFHAWFEMSEAGEFFLADAGSRNGTRVNGQPLSPKELSRLAPGADIEFGRVVAVLCDAQTLWSVATGSAVTVAA